MIIALSGKYRSGKDTTALFIQEEFQKRGIYFEIKSFADKLKYIVLILCGLDKSYYDQKEHYVPFFNMTLGQMYQKVGTECLRNNLDPDVWIKALFVDYTPDQNWIISDCRFQNEANFIKTTDNSYVIRVNRTLNYDVGSRDINHKSEIDLDYYDFDQIIENDGDLLNLKYKCSMIVNDILC